MSTLVSFFGIDDKPTKQSGHASAYLVSDSRITYEDGRPPRNDAQKVFACENYPAIFGYVGSETLEQIIIGLLKAINPPENGLFSGCFGSEAKSQRVLEYLQGKAGNQTPLSHDSTIVYIGRDDVGSANEARFHIWCFNRKKEMGSDWHPEQLKVPDISGGSKDCYSWGTGHHLLTKKFGRNLGPYEKQSDLTCAYPRATQQAIEAKHDINSGGPIQIAALFRGGNGNYLGMILEKKKYVCGKIWTTESPQVSRWVDEDFDECNPETLEKRSDRKMNPKLA
jgi:hypothetical protein